MLPGTQIQIKRVHIVLVNLDPVVGSEEGKTRPALIIQNNLETNTAQLLL